MPPQVTREVIAVAIAETEDASRREDLLRNLFDRRCVDLLDRVAQACDVPVEVPRQAALPLLRHRGQEDWVSRHLRLSDLALHLAEVAVAKALHEARDGGLRGARALGQLGRGIEQHLVGIFQHAIGQRTLRARHFLVFRSDQSFDRSRFDAV